MNEPSIEYLKGASDHTDLTRVCIYLHMYIVCIKCCLFKEQFVRMRLGLLCNRNLKISKALLKSQAHQFIHERCDESKGVFQEGQEKLRSDFQNTRRGTVFLGQPNLFGRAKVCNAFEEFHCYGDAIVHHNVYSTIAAVISVPFDCFRCMFNENQPLVTISLARVLLAPIYTVVVR